jgi:hypothetical protein
MPTKRQPAPPDSPRGQFNTIFSAGSIATVGAALTVLHDIDALRARLDDEAHYAALRARTHGATWEQIGDALNMSKQAAQQRWGALSDRMGTTEVER